MEVRQGVVQDYIRVKDYKRIEKAEVLLQPGLTMFAGHNSNGKSTLLKGLKAMVLNRSNDSHYRRGTKNFQIEWGIGDQSAEDGNPGIGDVEFYAAYGRQAGSAAYKHKDGKVSTKIGQQLLQDVCPEFPVRVFKFKNSEYFLPNFVFQGEIPLFSQVDIYELLSTMFGSVAKLLAMRDKLQEESKAWEGQVSAAMANLTNTSQQLGQAETDLRKIKVKEVEAEYKELQDYENSNYEFTSLKQKRDDLLAQLQKFKWYAWTDIYEMKDLEKVVKQAQEAEIVRPRLADYKVDIDRLRERVRPDCRPEPQENVQAWLSLAGIQETIKQLSGKFQDVPEGIMPLEDALRVYSIGDMAQFDISLAKLQQNIDDEVFPLDDVVACAGLHGMTVSTELMEGQVIVRQQEFDIVEKEIQEFKGLCPSGVSTECPIMNMVFGG